MASAEFGRARRAFRRRLGASVAAWLLGPAIAGEAAPGEAPLADARVLALRAEAAMRSDRTYLEARMKVSPLGLGRSRLVRFRSWDDRENDRSLIRVLEPAKAAGTTFLRLPPNLWRYAPREQRIERVPRSLLLESWMDGDFTHDDLLHASSRVDDYEHRLLRIEADPDGRRGMSAYVVEYVPHEDAPVSWPRIVAWIEVEDAVALRRDYYDRDGVVVRTLRFDDFRRVGGRMVPHRWISVWPGKKPRETRIELDSIRFDPTFEENLFSTGRLEGG